MATSSSVAHCLRPGRRDLGLFHKIHYIFKCYIRHYLCVCVCVCVCVCELPLMQKHNVLDIPENDLFLVEDVNRDVVAGVQMI